MKSKSIARTVLASVAIGALFGSAQLMAGKDDCHPVKGKILNSSHDPALGNVGGMGGVSTVGVVAFNGGNTFGKLKCALVGVAVGPGESQDGFLFNLPDFTHTISCDDSVDVSNEMIVHSQLTFDTNGLFNGFDGVCTYSFAESSQFRDSSGKGVFAGTTGGSLTVEGTFNFCTKSVDMKFTGDICME